MKKRTILFVICYLSIFNLKAQTIYYENFENFTVGNVSASSDGQTAGQGSWFVASSLTQSNSMPFEYLFQIQNDVANGKVITMVPPPYPYSIGNTSIRKDLNAVIPNRTTGYDVIKLEVDFYTAQQANSLNSAVDFGLSRIFNINNSATKVIAGFTFDNITGELKGTYYDDTIIPLPTVYQSYLNDNDQPLIVPFNTWVHCVVYADYINNKVVYEIPSMGVFVEKDFFVNEPYPINLTNHIPDSFSAITYLSDTTNSGLPTYKFDNVKVTALNQVLSTKEVLSNQFSLYPNPATNLVTITNYDNIIVNQIQIFDVTGKLVNVQNFKNESEIQLNVENFTKGSYLLYLYFNEGMAVKKMIKK